MDSILASIISKYSFTKNIHFYPNIPADKASKAISAYAQEIDYGDIVVLIPIET